MQYLKHYRKFYLAGLAGLLIAGASTVQAVPFTITGQLTGDIRVNSDPLPPDERNPSGLIVDVTITSDTTSNTASWTIDINSPLHPGIKLDEFYFNMVGPASNYAFSGYIPTDWIVATPADVQGAGGATFMFELKKYVNSADDVTNNQNLTFGMTLGSGLFTADLFLNAVTATSNDAGSGQMGAHLQSLTVESTTCPPAPQDSTCSDSGFAFGIYVSDGNGGGPGQQIPEPGVLALLGAGLLGFGAVRRRQR